LNLGERVSVLIVAGKNRIKGSVKNIFKHFSNDIDFSKPVILKPNIVFPVKNNTGEITRLNLVKCVVEVLKHDYGVQQILVGEGTAAGTIPARNFEVSGYLKLAQDLGIELIDLHKSERIPVEWKHGTLELPKILFEATYINLPILKISSAAVMSGAMKNQKGLLSPAMKKKFHRIGLHESIALLAKAIQPHLTIMDGSNFFRNNLLFAGTNLYEIDHYAAKLLGIDQPDYLHYSDELGLVRSDYQVTGTELVRRNNRKFQHNRYKQYLGLRLWSNPAACSMCRFSLEGLKHPLQEKSLCQTFRLYMKLLKYAIQGADFVFGSSPQFDENKKNIICIGDCTKELAKTKGFLHVPGCPPLRSDLGRYL